MSRIVAEEWIPVPMSRVFAFFSDPENLPRLMPPHLQAKIEDMHLIAPDLNSVVQSGGISGLKGVKVAGTESRIEVSFRLLPFLSFRGRWVARIVEYVPGVRFRDVQERGPMKSWQHSHEFEAQVRSGQDGTVVRDVLDYELPMGILGQIADALFVNRMITNTFISRQRALTRLLVNS